MFGQAVRYQRPISLLLIDCDNLKQINDTLCHKSGEALLVSLEREPRKVDVLARHGSDEFVVLLPVIATVGALDTAETIRSVAENSLALNGKFTATTVSIGVASYPVHGFALDLMLAIADRNMYQANLGGRNGVVQHAA